MAWPSEWDDQREEKPVEGGAVPVAASLVVILEEMTHATNGRTPK